MFGVVSVQYISALGAIDKLMITLLRVGNVVMILSCGDSQEIC